MKDIKEIIKSPEYSFLNTEARLGKNICLLTFGGSIAYGLDGVNSDIDIRGITLPRKEDLLGLKMIIAEEDLKNKNIIFGVNGFEQYTDINTDTTIYSLDKIIKLLYKCNPNTIEILGCNPESYTCLSEAGKMLIDNRHVFLSKMAYNSFSGYARGQFQRLKNALGNGGDSSLGRVISLADSINRMQSHLERSYPSYERNMIKLCIKDSDNNDVYLNGKKVEAEDIKVLFIDKSLSKLTTSDGTVIPDVGIQLMMDVNINNIKSSDFNNITNEITSAIKEFNSHLGHRNNKKDDYHLNKHAMHLVRLYLMAKDILLNEEIITYREKDRDFLLSIKNGEFMNSDRSFKQSFFDMIGTYEKELEEALRLSKLPDTPDLNQINKLVCNINEMTLKN